jgi:arylsulfatase A-like enzyme
MIMNYSKIYKCGKKHFLFIVLFVQALMFCLVTEACAKTSQDLNPSPNVVFILADDLGWSDLGCYGSEFYDTPNIDRLAERGIRFTNAYSANPFCSPTRASILTGIYPARIGLLSASGHSTKFNVEKKLREKRPSTYRAITPQPITRLKTEYTTIAEVFKGAGYTTGHFGKWHLGPEPYSPFEQGFDVDIPHVNSGGPPGGYLDASNIMGSAGLPVRPNEHVEDRMAEEAIKWMDQNKDKPFFLNYWAFSVHSPWEGKPDYIERFSNGLNTDNPQRHPVYAAMIKSMDDAVGRLIGAIDELGLSDNTIIVFTSDNGGVVKNAKNVSSLYQDIPVTSNAPLREGKGSIYEGGSRVPTIVSWAGKIKAASSTDALLSSIDFFPTLLEACGLAKPVNLKFDGISQLSVLKGGQSVCDVIYNQYPFSYNPAASIRQGNWKLIRFFCGKDDFTDRYELYDLKNDIGETNDLYSENDQRAKSLAKMLDDWLKDTESVIPIPNPDYDPDAKVVNNSKH